MIWSFLTNTSKHQYLLSTIFRRAYNLCLDCLISKLKYEFSSSLKGLCNDAFRFEFHDMSKSLTKSKGCNISLGSFSENGPFWQVPLKAYNLRLDCSNFKTKVVFLWKAFQMMCFLDLSFVTGQIFSCLTRALHYSRLMECSCMYSVFTSTAVCIYSTYQLPLHVVYACAFLGLELEGVDLPNNVREELLEKFTERQQVRGRKFVQTISARMRDKIRLHLLVLVLILDDFVVNCLSLQQDLKLSCTR